MLSFLIGVPLLVLGRVLLRRGLHAARRRGLFLHRVLVAGDHAHIDEIATIMHRESWLGYHVVGALRSHDQSDLETTAVGVPYVGEAVGAAEAATRMRADAIIVAGGAFRSSVDLRRAQWALEDQHVQVIVAPSITDVARERVTVRPVAGLPLVHLERPQGTGGAPVGEAHVRPARCVPAAAAGVAVDAVRGARDQAPRPGPGPVPADPGRAATAASSRCSSSAAWSPTPRPCSPRWPSATRATACCSRWPTTRGSRAPGRWLRRLSIDELPQLLNVLRGEMSLVGPRPPLPSEVEPLRRPTSRRRLRVRPGMTGLWQVSGRSDLSWEDTVRLDLYYVDNWSMLQDLTILARTLRAVFGSDGAY